MLLFISGCSKIENHKDIDEDMLRYMRRQRERVFAESSFRNTVSEEPPLSRICEIIVADSR